VAGCSAVVGTASVGEFGLDVDAMGGVDGCC